MITIPSLGNLSLSLPIVIQNGGMDVPLKSNSYRGGGSVLEMFLGNRGDHSNRSSREGSMGPPSRQSSNASVTSVSSLQDAGAAGSQFFEVLYLGKVKSVSHRKAPPTFIDDVLEKFRAHNQMAEEQKVRQSSLPVPVKGTLQLTPSKIPRPGEDLGQFLVPNGEQHPRSIINSSSASRLVDTQEEEESGEAASSLAQPPGLAACQAMHGSNNTLAMLKQTEEVLKTLSNRMETQPKTPELPPSGELQGDQVSPFRIRTGSGGSATKIEPLQRGRASSTGSCNRPKRVASSTMLEVPRPSGGSESNRTMLLQISRCDVKLISPDRKSVLLSKPFCDISHCSQGVQNPDNFGFICRDATSENNNVCYVFKCQNSSVADEIMAVLKMACNTAAEAQKRIQLTGNVCEQCPTVWLERLMADVEGLSDYKAHQLLMKRIATLPEADQHELITKYKGADLIKTSEQNDLLMLLLKAHCEARQMTHVHDTAENRHEFLSQYFDRGSGAIFKKAKRSLTNSFDQLLKRKTTDEVGGSASSPPPLSANNKSNGAEAHERTPTKQAFRFDMADGLCQSPLATVPDSRQEPPATTSTTGGIRPRSSTLCSSHGDTIKKELKDIKNKRRTDREQEESVPPAKQEEATSPNRTKSPIMDIFFKVGSPSSQPQGKVAPPAKQAESALSSERTPSPRRPSSWRQAIFQQVKTPNNQSGAGDFNLKVPLPGESAQPRTRLDYRALWRKAIKQQILLIRMEKENKRLKAHQEEMAIKRMKLHYDEIVPCPRPVAQIWEKLLSPASADQADFTKVVRAVEKGVPKQRRGDAWRLLISKRSGENTPESFYSLCRPEEIDYDRFPLLDMTYEELLGQLTSHQHAIIIDLGRTFPSHKYYQASLGPGQLSLFNLLKAYSLFDSEVGYCQGLSFIAGILLLHLDEKEAYQTLRFLMLDLGLRRQYLPDMAALQVQLYQMARLLRDLHRDLYEHMEENEISPALYAAPWFLTLFASQFPLGFVVRVFDLIFSNGISMVFRVALSLLVDHKDMLLQCRNFEQLMDYFKTTLPFMGATQLERVIRKALELDISRQLAAYEVEYHVLQEEIMMGGSACGIVGSSGLGASPASGSSMQSLEQQLRAAEDCWKEKSQRLEEMNQVLQKQVRELQAQLQSAKVTTRILENNLTASQSKYIQLERKFCDYESDRSSLIQLVTELMKQLPAGQEMVIPPDLVRCLEEFSTIHQEEGGISISTPSLR